MRAVGGIQKIQHTGLRVLDREDGRMRVRHQHETLAALAQSLEKAPRTRQPCGAMRFFAVQRGDVDAQFARPEIDAIPLEPALPVPKLRREFRLRFGERQAVVLGINFRDAREPHETVESQIEQSAVEIEQHGIDTIPIEGGFDLHRARCNVHVGYHTVR